MSLYANYVKERSIDCIMESDKGFATYRYLDGGRTVYIVDIYVLPEHRKNGTASSLADLIAHEAKSKGCVEMFGTVAPIAVNSTDSVRTLLAYGMKIHSVKDGLIVFSKEL